MKDKLIYIVIFAFAFLLVTLGIIYFNSRFENIFAFNFSPTAEVQETGHGSDPGNNYNNSGTDSLRIILGGLIDSIKSGNFKRDTVRVQTILDTTLIDSIEILKKKLEELSAIKKEEKKPVQQKIINEIKSDTVKPKIELASTIQPKDSLYKVWIKKTGSLYEAMDSRKAAKIIATYSDNIAKDILYAMKRKKAAEILAQLNPETVNRITSTK